MKLWQKIYLTTLILFLILINGGIYMAFHMTYSKDLRVEQNRSEASFRMLESSLERNMEILKREAMLDDAQIHTLLKGYEEYFEKNDIRLKIWKEDENLYPGGEKKDSEIFQEDTIRIRMINEGVKKVQITKVVTGFDDVYFFYYEQPLRELSETWKSLQKGYLLMSFVCSLILAIALFVILQRLMKPIRELTAAVAQMKNGEHGKPVHVTVHGKDDIACLGMQFNEMTDTIAENMTRMQEESLKKQQFIDNFAHELKSPLTSIYGFAEYIDRANVSKEEQSECLQFIMEESRRMLQLSYTLLDMAQLRGTELVKQEIDAVQFCEAVAFHVQAKLKEKEIPFSFQADDKKLYGNDILLQTLVANLITNAIYASAHKSPITMKVTINEQECVIEVTDKGCGMEESAISHVAEPFYRVDKARSREDGGTGLGLSLCSQIVKVHEGQMKISSKVNEGTTVRVYLPNKKSFTVS